MNEHLDFYHSLFYHLFTGVVLQKDVEECHVNLVKITFRVTFVLN